MQQVKPTTDKLAAANHMKRYYKKKADDLVKEMAALMKGIYKIIRIVA